MTISLPASLDLYRPRPSRRSGSAIGLVLAAHLAIVWLAMRPVATKPEPDHRVWTPLLLPREVSPVYLHRPAPSRVDLPPAGTADAPHGARPPAPASSTDESKRSTAQARSQNSEQSPGADQPATRSGATNAAPADDWSLPAAPAKPVPGAGADADKALPAGLLAQALKSAGAIDRQLRAEHPQEFTAPADTPQTRLAKGMAEAHAAVKPGWLEPARIELFSAPNDPKRIYKVITAAGEYCVYYADKGSMSENLSARAGHASFGEARVAPCPIRF